MEGNGIGLKGRRGKPALIDGDIMEVRSLINLGHSEGVSLPKLWLELLRQRGELVGIGIRLDGDTAILKPYYGDNIKESEGHD